MIRPQLRIRSRSAWSLCFGVEGGGSSRCPIIVVSAASPSNSFAKPLFQCPPVPQTTEAKIGLSVSFRSYHHKARGYLAGLHSYQPKQQQQAGEEPQPDFESFEAAWEAIQSVPDEFLKDFEDELWETQSKRFVYGSKQVSVIDAVVDEPTKACRESASPTSPSAPTTHDAKVVRYLVWNERPNLIQTAVEVSSVGAPYRHYIVDNDKNRLVARPPSPISQTHLGGLAMALPFWHKANSNSDNYPDTRKVSPNCLLIGAGGCSLAHTLAANLFLEGYNQKATSDTNSKSSTENPQLTAVEASPEILRASKQWFGAGTEGNNEEKRDCDIPEPPFFDLVQSTGELYLESLAKSKQEDSDGSNHPSPIDILIIDAEDGSAPPQSMRTPEFWNNLVLPSLNLDGNAIVGVNSIGTNAETNELVRIIQKAFCGDKTSLGREYTILVVAPPSEAEVTDRHKLIFALPRKQMAQNDPALEIECWSLSKEDLNGHVDVPGAWEQEIKVALQAVLGDKLFQKAYCSQLLHILFRYT